MLDELPLSPLLACPTSSEPKLPEEGSVWPFFQSTGQKSKREKEFKIKKTGRFNTLHTPIFSFRAKNNNQI
jgi:hypothetical protein